MATPKQPEPPPSSDDLRGVETFDTEERLLLVLAPVEHLAAALAKRKQADLRERDVLGKTVTLGDPSFLVLRLRGHPWSLVVACTAGRDSDLTRADAAALSKTLKTRAIYFANSDCASATEYELLDNGSPQEHFRCVDTVEFTSEARDVDPPEDGPDLYTFVDRFMRGQDAFVPALSLHLETGWMKPGRKVKLDAQDELPPEAFERVDLVAVTGRAART